MKTFAAMILGCKVNDYEATCICNRMKEHFEEVPFEMSADIYLIFTCCVTNVAESKTRKFIHRARRQNPDALIVAIGCLSQIKSGSSELEDVDIFIGSSRKDEVVDIILNNVRGNCVEKGDTFKFETLSLDSYPGKSRAFLKIQDGCNQFCAYCIIPYSRGRERSGDHNTLIKQAQILSESFHEIVLTGIHTGRYHDGEYKLYDLLKDLLEKTDISTIRLSSIEVTEVTDEIIELMKNSGGRIAHHLHIPIQAASDEILKAMRRPYDLKYFKERIGYIRKEIPGISISTDLIVGFPGESDEIFEASLKELEEISFSFIHCFPYSRKKGTLADRMPGHIDPAVKKQRLYEVMKTEKPIALNYRKGFIGKKVEVLIEKNEEGCSFGYAKEYFYVTVKGVHPVGSVIKVNISDVTDDKIIGEACI